MQTAKTNSGGFFMFVWLGFFFFFWGGGLLLLLLLFLFVCLFFDAVFWSEAFEILFIVPYL